MMEPGLKSFMGIRAAKHSSDLELCFHVITHETRNPPGQWRGVSFTRQPHSVAAFSPVVQQEERRGEVWVESRKNQGATFFFALPNPSPEAHV